MKKNLRFYIALWGAKLTSVLLKLLHRNASYLPGKIALKICPDMMGQIQKPEKIIAVTGTNGKTTVSNMLIEALQKCGIDTLNNRLGSNIDAGIATSLIYGSDMFRKCKKTSCST